MCNKYKHLLTVLLLILLAYCSSEKSGEVKLSPKAAIVDSLLSQPYNVHFKNIQNDYSVAYSIGYKIEELKYETKTPMALTGLLSKSAQLGENPNKINYAALQKEWESMKISFAH